MSQNKVELFTRNQLCLVLGVSRITIQNWINRGLPVAEKDESLPGSPRNLFDYERVTNWLLENKNRSARPPFRRSACPICAAKNIDTAAEANE